MNATLSKIARPSAQVLFREPTLAALRETATLAALAAGRVLVRNHSRRPVVPSEDGPDLKHDVDRAAKEALVDVIRRAFPEDEVVSREAGPSGGHNRPGRLWIVSHLDGAVNFVHGIPWFCTSVACLERRPEMGATASDAATPIPWYRAAGLRPLAAAIYQPVSEELFVAVSGSGATLNGAALRLMAERRDESPVSVTVSAGGGLAGRLVEQGRTVRSFGCTALDLAYVAAGRLGVHAQDGAHLWDFAAAAIVLEEAGGVIEASETRLGRWQLLASGPGTHAEASIAALS
jgi:fructose-1,6-bisphosphatase/inositol monophosphatase family enzyme